MRILYHQIMLMYSWLLKYVVSPVSIMLSYIHCSHLTVTKLKIQIYIITEIIFNVYEHILHEKSTFGLAAEF